MESRGVSCRTQAARASDPAQQDKNQKNDNDEAETAAAIVTSAIEPTAANSAEAAQERGSDALFELDNNGGGDDFARAVRGRRRPSLHRGELLPRPRLAAVSNVKLNARSCAAVLHLSRLLHR